MLSTRVRKPNSDNDAISSVLYARVIGQGWQDLPACVRRLHTTFSPNTIHGRFEVRHGRSRAARRLARLLRLPAEAAGVDIVLAVEERPEGQTWIREFGDVKIVTTQWSDEGRLLHEQFGMIEFRFRLEVEEGCLIYRQRNAALRIGRWSFGLPGWLAPLVSAIEKPSADTEAVSISVEVTVPGVGLLLAYSGEVSCDSVEVRS
jgi:hypothetical protein